MTHLLAYIDAGVGALIWQSIIGVFVGMVFYLRRTRKWIGGIMGKFSRTEKKTSSSEEALHVSKGKLETDPS